MGLTPRTAGLDIEGLNTDPPQPFPQCCGDKFRPVVGSDMLWWSMPDEEFSQFIEHIPRVEFPLDTNGQALPGELIDDTKHTEDLTIMGAVLDKIVAPDMASMGWSQPYAGAVVQPQTSAFRLFLRDLQPFTSPDPVDPSRTDLEAAAIEKRSDPAVPIPAVLLSQLDNRLGQYSWTPPKTLAVWADF